MTESVKILLAEDNPVNQKVAELMLRKMGYEIDIAANGKIAVEKLEKKPYDIILMDAQMPVMDGLEATRTIRERLPREKQPRIVVMTATMLVEARELWKDIEVDGFIEKPVRVELMKRQMDEIVEEIRRGD